MENEAIIHSQVFHAFFDTYIPLSQQAGEVLKKTDEMERREAIARIAPNYRDALSRKEKNITTFALLIKRCA